MKSALCPVLIIILLACNNRGREDRTTAGDSSVKTSKGGTASLFVRGLSDTALQSRIEDTLLKLPFVKKTNDYIDSFSHHQHGIAFISDTADNEISVMAGYNGPERFETYFNFVINPKTLEIRVLNAVTGEFVSVEEYIKKNKE